MKYEVMASETVIYRILIEAESEDEAIEKVRARNKKGQYRGEYDGFQIDKVRLK